MVRLPRPSLRLAVMLLVGVIPAALTPLWPGFGAAVLALNAALLACVAWDVWLVRRYRIETQVLLPERGSRQNPIDIVWRIRSHAPRALTLYGVRHNGDTQSDLKIARAVQPGETIESVFTATPAQRGAFCWDPPVLTFATPLGLGWVDVWPPVPPPVEVLPSTRDLGRFETLVRQHKLHQMGVVRARQLGSGNELAGLRPYAPGDPPARIDWKATARKGVPIAREMHAETRQNLIVLLDCGRRMAREVAGRSRLDDAIEAAMLLAHVALRSDDRVGLAAFADTMLRMLPPVRGSSSAGALAQAMFDLTPVLRESAYQSMAGRVHATYAKRSLMVLFTDAVEPESLANLARPIRFLSTHHLVLCVTFKDASMLQAMRQGGDDVDSFFCAGAASDLFVERRRNLAGLRRAGAMLLEAEAGRLSTDVINHYLDIKARHLL